MNDNPSPDCVLVNKDSLGPYDIICGRCSTAYNNIGNRRFRVTIGLNLRRYMEAPTRREKSAVIQSVVDVLLREAGARFLKQKGSGYLVLDAKQVRQKIQHALRDMAAFKLFDDETEATTNSSERQVSRSESSNSTNSHKQHNTRPREADRTVDDDEDISLLGYAPFLDEEHMLISTIETTALPKSKPEPIAEFIHLTATFEDREDSDHFLNKGDSVTFFAAHHGKGTPNRSGSIRS